MRIRHYDPRYPYLEPNKPALDPGVKKKITRIDVYQNPTNLFVAKYAEGWTASTPAYEKHFNESWTLEQAVAWMQANGYTVRAWPGGARGWLGPILPVRDHSGIIRKRRECERFKPHSDMQVHAMDFAFDG